MRTRTGILILAAACAVAIGGVYFYRQATRSVPADLGVPVYPGARLQDTLTVRGVRTVVLETADPPRAVIDFYKARAGGRTRVLEREIGGSPGAVMELETEGRRRLLTISVDPQSGRTLVVVAHRPAG